MINTDRVKQIEKETKQRYWDRNKKSNKETEIKMKQRDKEIKT